jgi:hypothetical protein
VALVINEMSFAERACKQAHHSPKLGQTDVIPKFTECSDDAYLAAGHWIVAHDLEWDPLNMEDGEEILVKTFTFDEALAAIRCDYRCDPQAVLALWLYAGKLCLSVG